MAKHMHSDDSDVDPEPSLSEKQINEKKHRERQEAEERECRLVGCKVMKLLGAPADFARVDAKRVATHRFRVNVRVDVSTETVLKETRIAHSFFVEVFEDGELAWSDPAIKRLYSPA